MDDEIDQLYQLPLAEFTDARNELAKRESVASRAAEIRALKKPTLPAWVVNQFFWKRRKLFDRLLEAARRVRVEHGRQLSGKGAEIAEAEARHRDALKAATDEIRALLRAASEEAAPATMLAVSETLQAIPGRDDLGRLVKPLKPLGFEALAGLVPKGGATIARLAEAKPAPSAHAAKASPGRSAREDAAARKRDTQARARQTAAVERELRRARADERSAKAEFARAEMTLARLQRDRKDLQERIDNVTSRRDQAAVAQDEHRREAEKATAERERLESRLKIAKSHEP